MSFSHRALVALALVATCSASPAFGDDPPQRLLPSGRMATQFGDILIYEGRSLTCCNHWPVGIVPYAFNANVSAPRKALFRSAVAQWETYSAVRFIEDDTAFDRILVSDDPKNIGCGSSAVGKQGGSQDLLISCWQTRTIAHEAGHAIAFLHEHQRPDRASYVAIEDVNGLANAHPDVFQVNWGIVGAAQASAYDFGSIMHYARSGSVTINNQTYVVRISATQAQPPGPPAGSETYCVTPLQCTDAMGAGVVSPRDGWGAALRYGYRLDLVQVPLPQSGVLTLQGGDSCGFGCMVFARGASGTISFAANPGQIGMISTEGCFAVGSNPRCVITLDRNRTYSAWTTPVTTVLSAIEDKPRSGLPFGDGFE